MKRPAPVVAQRAPMTDLERKLRELTVGVQYRVEGTVSRPTLAWAQLYDLMRAAANLGAEAMREACVKRAEQVENRWAGPGTGWEIIRAIRALPLSEEP